MNDKHSDSKRISAHLPNDPRMSRSSRALEAESAMSARPILQRSLRFLIDQTKKTIRRPKRITNAPQAALILIIRSIVPATDRTPAPTVLTLASQNGNGKAQRTS